MSNTQFPTGRMGESEEGTESVKNGQELNNGLDHAIKIPMGAERQDIINLVERIDQSERKEADTKQIWIDAKQQQTFNVYEEIDQVAVMNHFRRYLDDHCQSGTPLTMQGPQDLFAIAGIPISPDKYKNIGREWGPYDHRILHERSQLLKIWTEAFLEFMNAQTIRQSEIDHGKKRKILSNIVDIALLSRYVDDYCNNTKCVLEYMTPDDALLCAATVSRCSDIDDAIRGYITQYCTTAFVGYRFDPNDRIGKATIAEQLDVLHFLPSLHAHAIRGASDPEGNGDEEFMGWDSFEQGHVCRTARRIAASKPIPVILYAEKLAEQRVGEEDENPSLPFDAYHQVTSHQPSSRPDASWSRLPEVPQYHDGRSLQKEIVGTGFLKTIASNARGEFDGSGMLRTISVMREGKRRKLMIRDACQDTSINPFGEKTEKDLPLLLQHLQRPEMRKLIEQDLQIDFKQIPLASQIHLLRFLQDANEQTFNELRFLLQNHPNDTSAILTSFLACSQDKDMGRVLIEIARHEGTGPIFQTYTTLVETAESTAQEVAELHRSLAPMQPLTVDDIYRALLKNANGIVRTTLELLNKSDPTLSGSIALKMEPRIRHENQRIAVTSALVSVLSSGEISRLNLNALATVEMKNVAASQFLKEKNLHSLCDEMTRTIAKNFPEGDADDFQNRYLRDPSAEITYATCDTALLSFFGTTRMPDGTRYLDWYNTSPTSPIKGLAEATAYTAINRLKQDEDFYLVAKPHVRSHEIFSRVGFVTFGTTDKGEYQHRYLRCRKLNEEQHQYVGKELCPEEMQLITSTCKEANTIYPLLVRDTETRICRVEYSGIDHEDDIAVGTKDNFLYQTIDALCANNVMIMSAYIPDIRNSSALWRKENRSAYYCLFEPSKLPEDRIKKLYNSIHDFHTLSTQQYSNSNETA